MVVTNNQVHGRRGDVKIEGQKAHRILVANSLKQTVPGVVGEVVKMKTVFSGECGGMIS